jgi:hypothetical protein
MYSMWPARRADNLAAIYEPMSENVGSSTSHSLYRDNFTILPFGICLKFSNHLQGTGHFSMEKKDPFPFYITREIFRFF